MFDLYLVFTAVQVEGPWDFIHTRCPGRNEVPPVDLGVKSSESRTNFCETNGCWKFSAKGIALGFGDIIQIRVKLLVHPFSSESQEKSRSLISEPFILSCLWAGLGGLVTYSGNFPLPDHFVLILKQHYNRPHTCFLLCLISLTTALSIFSLLHPVT